MENSKSRFEMIRFLRLALGFRNVSAGLVSYSDITGVL